MAKMIDGVLTYSIVNGHEQKIEKLDLNDILLDIQYDLEVAIQQKNAVVKYNALPIIEGNAVLIYQLFYNLINNSLKFSKNHGETVIIIASRITSVEAGDFARIEIADNGIGFDPDYSKKIFEAFSRLNPKDEYEGTGLGLALCKKIVERHHGTIEAVAKVGEGAIFTIMLPMQQRQTKNAATAT
jgi:signal transduction histidine kinase